MMLPSKKVLSMFILTAALVASSIIAFGKDKGTAPINFASNLLVGEKISVPENPNWQNDLGKVSLLNLNLEEESATSSAETTTDTISRTLVSNYLALKQGGTLNQESAQKLIDQTSDYLEAASKISVEPSKLNVIPDNGKQTISDYGEKLGIILKTNKPADSGNELSILQETLNKKDPRMLNELQRAIDTYEGMTREMMSMPVPKTFVKAHVDMVSGMLKLTAGLKEIKKVFEDPFRGLQGVQVYQDGGTLFVEAIQASSEFIKQSGVVYKQGSGGYYLLYGI